MRTREGTYEYCLRKKMERGRRRGRYRRTGRKKPAAVPEEMLLHCAAAEGNLDLVKELIEEKSHDPEHKTPDGITPLHCASCCGRLEVVTYLIDEMNCDPTAEDKYGECPIVYSAACTIERAAMRCPLNRYPKMVRPRIEHIKVALFLLKSRIKKIEVIRSPKLLRVLRLPLFCDSLADLPQMIDVIKLGNDCSSYLFGKELHEYVNMAIDKSEWDYVINLLHAYPKYIRLAMASDLNRAQAVFHDARCYSNYQKGVHLIKAFFDLDLEIFKPDVKLVKKAIDNNNYSIVHYLLEVAGHPLDVDKHGESWSSLLLYVLNHSKCRYHRFDEELVQLVSTIFSGIDIKDDKGNNPLHLACGLFDGTYCKAVVALFATNGNYQSASNNNNQLPLHVVCNNEHIKHDTIRLVSSQPGLDVNKQDSNGNTPLHTIFEAIPKYYHQNISHILECCRYLIVEKKCDVNIKNNKEELPLHILLKRMPLKHHEYDGNERETLITLCSRCIHVNTQDIDGNTPLHIACKDEDLKTVMFLTSNFRCDTNLLNIDKCLPLHYATSSNMPLEAVKAVSAGCTQTNNQNKSGLTPLHIACSNWQLDVVRFLVLDKGFSKQLSDIYDNLDISVLCQSETDMQLLKLLATIKNASLRGHFNCHAPIHIACANNNLVAAKYLIDVLNCDLSCKDSKGRLPFHVACSQSIECVKLIASSRHNDEDVNTGDHRGNTPLHLALKHNCIDITRFLLLNYPCNVNLYNFYEELPVYLASSTTLEMVKLVTPHDIFLANINRQSRASGGTPLHVACQSGRTEIVRYLVERFQCAPSMKERDNDGKLPVDYSCRYSLEMVKLVSQSCTIKELGPRNDATGWYPKRRVSTTLDIACCYGTLDIVDYLINQKGCDLSAFRNDQCALLYACGLLRAHLQTYHSNSYCESRTTHSHPDIVEFLVTKCGYNPGMSVSTSNIQYYFINSTFQHACEQNDLNLMKALTILSVDQSDDQGNTPLHYACAYGCTDIVKYLIDHDCDQTIFNHDGELALHLACDSKSKNSLEIIQVLTKCDVNSVNSNGDNLLHIACTHSRTDVIKYLIEVIKFDLNVRNKLGQCPIHRACTTPEAIQLLQSYGCDTNCQDDKGDTPLHIACSCKSHKVIRRILSSQSCRANILNKNGDLALHNIVQPHHNYSNSFTSSDHFIYEISSVQELSLEVQKSMEMVIKRHSAALVSINNDGFTPIHFAVLSGELNIFEALNNMDFDFSSTIGSSFLHIACEYRQSKIVSWLIEHGAKLTIVDSEGNLPQHSCFLGKQPLCLQTLSRLGTFDLYSQNHSGDTIIHMACRHRKHDLLLKVLESNKDCSKAMSIQNSDKDTPLHLAACTSLEHVMLVATPENINMQNNDGDTPLHVACQFLDQPSKAYISDFLSDNSMRIIYYLVHHMKCSVELFNKNYDSPFHILLGRALKKSSIDPLLQYIPKALCDRKNMNGETLLHIACKQANSATVSYLIETLKCKTDLVVERSGATALHFACLRDFVNPIRLISDCCPVTQITDSSASPKDWNCVCGDTALHIASRKGNCRITACLLEGAHKNALNVSNSLNELPFHLACHHGEKMVKVFVTHAVRFDCNAITAIGDTPLHIVCRNMCWHAESVIKLLLDKFRCNAGITNKQKNLPLHVACQHIIKDVSLQVIDKLTAALNADQLSSQNLCGDTALHTLLKFSCDSWTRCYKRKTPIVQLLVERMPILAIAVLRIVMVINLLIWHVTMKNFL